MKRLICIVQTLLTGTFVTACGSLLQPVEKTTTQHADGTTTTVTVPVASPEDVLFQERCNKVLERSFGP